jgi:hypothetical protein
VSDEGLHGAAVEVQYVKKKITETVELVVIEVYVLGTRVATFIGGIQLLARWVEIVMRNGWVMTRIDK